MNNNYEVIAAISGILGTYARYNFMQTFREGRGNKPRLELAVMGLFYLVSQGTYFYFDIPLVNLLVQIFFLVLVGHVMELGFKKTLLAASVVVLIVVAVESAVVFMTGYVSGSLTIRAGYQSIFGIVAVHLTTLLVSFIFKNFSNVRRNIDIPFTYWMAGFVFPISSLTLLIVIFSFSGDSSAMVVVSTIMVIIMNIIVFYMYDRLMWQYNRKLEETIIENMNIRYKKQLEMMRTSLHNSSSLRHDLKRHLSTMEVLLREGNMVDLKEYMDQIKGKMDDERMVSKTGNLVIDSIINYEVYTSEAGEDRIQIKSRGIPKSLGIQDQDLTVVIGNLVSNALNAATQVQDGKVYIQIRFDKGVFYVGIENDYDGYLKHRNGKLVTTHKDESSHGYGLENIRMVLEKYCGDLFMEHSESRFRTEVVIYESSDMSKD